MSQGIIPEKLRDFTERTTLAMGFQLVSIDIKGGRGLSIEVTVDKPGGITLDECGELNRRIVAWAEETCDAGQVYTVDVSSPGLDRELKKDRDFVWATGKDIEIVLREPLDKGNKVSGHLSRVEDNGDIVMISHGGGEIRIPRANIARAKLDVPVSLKKQK